jgi:hypothetical protein
LTPYANQQATSNKNTKPDNPYEGKENIMRCRALIIYSLVVFLVGSAFAQTAVAQEKKQEDLAAQARDPTASLTMFQIRYDYTASFHGVDDADMGTIVLQPIIPFKIGEIRNIARITVPYVTNAPDFGALTDIDQNPLPPNYVPTEDKSGLADTALLDLIIFDASWGRWGIGPVLTVPTASDDALGTGKWSIGPAVVGLTTIDKLMCGLLGTGLFSVAGDSDRQDVSALTLQPFASYGLSHGWSIGLSEVSYTYNFEQDKWAGVPIGGRIEKLVQLGKLPVRLFVDAEYNLMDDDIAPEWTFRFAFVPLL